MARSSTEPSKSYSNPPNPIQMIYFASDIHLGAGNREEQRRTEEHFLAWLDHVGRDAEVVVLLGDLFDFWFEYKRVVPQGYVRTLGKLAELTDRGIQVLFFPGNHDQWTGDYLTRECGVKIYNHPQILRLKERNLFLAHGDNMRVKQGSLLWLMNRCFRSKGLRWLFQRLIHPDLALKFGRWWSGKSRKSHSKTPLEVSFTEPLRDYARDHFATHPEVDCYLFGHMHIAVDRLNETPRILHLGCWEETITYAVLDDNEALHLAEFEK